MCFDSNYFSITSGLESKHVDAPSFTKTLKIGSHKLNTENQGRRTDGRTYKLI